MQLQQVFQSMVDQAGVKRLYGEPVTNGAKTIVPVASIIYSFGGGSGARHRSENEAESGGGGGWCVARPIGFIEITSEYARFIPINERKRLAAAIGIGVAIGLFLGWRRCRAARDSES
jgi:uncharacterized spore protein YtfJ